MDATKTASSDFSNMSNRLSKWQHNDLQPKLSAMADNCGCEFFFTILHFPFKYCVINHENIFEHDLPTPKQDCLF